MVWWLSLVVGCVAIVHLQRRRYKQRILETPDRLERLRRICHDPLLRVTVGHAVEQPATAYALVGSTEDAHRDARGRAGTDIEVRDGVAAPTWA